MTKSLHLLLVLLLPAIGCADAAPTAEFSVSSGISPFQVLQRDATGHASATLRGTGSGATVWGSVLRDGAGEPILAPQQIASLTGDVWSGRIENIPTGGVYTLQLSLRDEAGAEVASREIGGILVGDLWVLAGQSNMEGVGDLVGAEEPDPFVNLLQSDRTWAQAREPLHWILESPDEVHWLGKQGKDLEGLRSAIRATRTKGVGPGLSFAKRVVKETGVPIGLLATAHGGTSMAQWDPEQKAEGGKSLYGSMCLSVEAAGGHVTGVLWYQGESDASPAEVKVFRERFTNLVASMRRDFNDPNLPFLYVQIGRIYWPREDNHANWLAIQDIQRLAAGEIPNSAVVGTVDLPLDDLVHISTAGQKRLGNRLAQQALRMVYRQPQYLTGPRLEKLTIADKKRLVVRAAFSGVNGSLSPAFHIAGFRIVDAAGVDQKLLYDVRVDSTRPDSVLLKMWRKLESENDLFVTYGWDGDPYCNLVDAQDEGCLVFGPQTLRGIEVEAPAD